MGKKQRAEYLLGIIALDYIISDLGGDACAALFNRMDSSLTTQEKGVMFVGLRDKWCQCNRS